MNKWTIKYGDYYIANISTKPEFEVAESEGISYLGSAVRGIYVSKTPLKMTPILVGAMVKTLIALSLENHIPSRQIVINPEGEKTNELIE